MRTQNRHSFVFAFFFPKKDLLKINKDRSYAIKTLLGSGFSVRWLVVGFFYLMRGQKKIIYCTCKHIDIQSMRFLIHT